MALQSSTVPSDPIPSIIGPYRPLSKLGQGGMGVVYRAQDSRKPDLVVALKVMSQQDFGAGDSVRRFEREAKILQSLRHRNIVQLYEIGLYGDQSYVAMELLEGRTLGAFIGRTYRDLLPLFTQYCEGMEYLASRSIIHRDLSPDNVFVVPFEGELVVKILDFGLAKDTGRTETLFQFTKTGLLMGKPPYWSPEMLGTLPAGQKLDIRSDIYASGVIFFRALSGVLPFTGDSPYSYAYAHLNLKARELIAPAGNPRIPEELRDLVFSMLEKNREKRVRSFSTIREQLVRIQAEFPEQDEIELHGPEDPDGAIANWQPPRPSLTPATASPASAGTDATMRLPGFGPPSRTPFPKGVSEELGGFSGDQPTMATAPPAPVAGPGAGPRQTSRWAMGTVVAIVLATVGIGGAYFLTGWFPFRKGATIEKKAVDSAPLPATASTAPLSAPGSLALNGFPWARIVSLVEKPSGRSFPLAGDFVTPLVLPLSAGHYTLELSGPAGSDTQKLDVEVKSNETVTYSVRFTVSGNPLQLLE